MTSSTVPHIPVLRHGVEYSSLDQVVVSDHRTGLPLARVSQANAGLIRRDLRSAEKMGASLRSLTTERMLAIFRDAGRRFTEDTLPLNGEGDAQSPEDYVRSLSATSGLPHSLVRRNMSKVHTVFMGMEGILNGLTRGLDPDVLDRGRGTQGGVAVSFAQACTNLGVVLPSNSPGVNSIWMPSVALRVPVVLKPGREEPWTPLRIVQALIAAGCPRGAFSLYPTDHEGAATILGACGRSLLFGDEGTTRQYATDPRIQIHGPGRSKVLLGADAVRSWRRHLPVLLASVADNGGRSCINASTIFTPSRGEEIADGLARELAGILPLRSDDDDARLASFANPKMAAFIEASIEAGLAAGGAEDVTARHRVGPRSRTVDDAAYVLPTVVLCASVDHPLARTEFLFPFVAVVEVPQEEMVARLGPSLVVTAVTEDAALIDALFRSPDVDRINVGPIPTSSVEWDQPHEGNLFEFLYRRRAVQWAALDPMAPDGSAEGSA